MALSPRLRASLRLLVLQASWTYERMQGVGAGFASIPLLEALRDRPEKHREALARSSELFNAHPYLAGVAVGAAARAEQDGVAGATIQRLKTALAGPLGSLGDQLFWIGVVPATLAVMLIAVAFGGSWPVVAIGVALYLAIRLATTVWAVRLGHEAGLGISTALKDSGLAERVRRVGLVAGLLVGVAVPITGRWLDASTAGAIALGVGAVGGIVAALVRQRIVGARLLTLAAMAIILLWHWSRS